MPRLTRPLPAARADQISYRLIELNETAYYPFWYTGDREAASRVEAWDFVVGGIAGDAFARCLSEPGRQYAIYAHHSVVREPRYVVQPGVHRESWVLEVLPADYVAEWVDPELGQVIRRERIGQSGPRPGSGR